MKKILTDIATDNNKYKKIDKKEIDELFNNSSFVLCFKNKDFKEYFLKKIKTETLKFGDIVSTIIYVEKSKDEGFNFYEVKPLKARVIYE